MAARKKGAKAKPRTTAKAKAPAARKSSAPSTRARGKSAAKAAPKHKPSPARKVVTRKPNAPAAPHVNKNGHPGAGRPKDTPDVWTPEHIDEVADQMWAYIRAADCPTEAEFCYLYLIDHQRLGEIPILRRLKDFMFAKRQAYTINKGIRLAPGDGARGAFLAKLAANAGPFSLVDKSENTIRGGPRPFSNLGDEELEKIIADELAERANG